jgi:hypothetical protein
MTLGAARNPLTGGTAMEFSPQEALEAAERIIRPARTLVGARPPAAPVHFPKPVAAGVVRTLGPGDPPPFDRVIRPRFSVRAFLAIALVLVLVLPIAASVLTAGHR